MPAVETGQDSFKTDVLEVQDTPVLVDFWAPWCGPCQMQGPILDELADEIGDKAKILKVNVDNNKELANKFEIVSIPTLIVFKKGKLVEKIIGALPEKELEKKFSEL